MEYFQNEQNETEDNRPADGSQMLLLILQSNREIQEQMVKIQHSLTSIEQRVGAVEDRIGDMEHRIGDMEHRISSIERRLTNVEHQIGLDKIDPKKE